MSDFGYLSLPRKVQEGIEDSIGEVPTPAYPALFGEAWEVALQGMTSAQIKCVGHALDCLFGDGVLHIEYRQVLRDVNVAMATKGAVWSVGGDYTEQRLVSDWSPTDAS